MNIFHKREASIIIAEHDEPSNSINITEIPSYANYILQVLLGINLAEDFQIADEEFIKNENQNISYIRNSFTDKWIAFALSGQGDYWLLHKTKNTVGFYDHNKEDFAVNNIQELGITVEEWIVLGDLFHQYDLLNEFNPSAFNDNYTLKSEYKIDFADKINSIKEGLFETLPFNAI
jgi:hypothetical protein